MADVPIKFRAWFKSLLFGKWDGVCLSVSVRQLGQKGGADVATFVMPEAGALEEDGLDAQLAVYADQLWELAQNDADGFEGVTTYAMYAWFDKHPDKSPARFVHRFSSRLASEDGNDDPSVTENADARGLASQAMRHTEAMARIMTQGAMHQISSLTRSNENKDRIIEQLLSDKLESIETVEELASKRHERQLEVIEKEAKVKVIKDAMDRIGPLVPVLAAKLTGTKLLPAGTKGAGALKEFMASVTPEQFEGMQQMLRPEQLGALAAIMSELQDDEEKEQAEASH